MLITLARAVGIEPTLRGLESLVLPLYEALMMLSPTRFGLLQEITKFINIGGR